MPLIDESNEIVHIITTIDRGGAERQLLQLCQYQIEHGSKVTVIPLKGRTELGPEFSQIGARVNLFLLNKNPLIQLVLLVCFITGEKESIFHAHLPRSELLTSLACIFRNISLISSKHNAEPFFPNGNKILSRIFSRYCYYKSNAIICISYYVKEFLAKLGEIPSDTEKVKVIHYGFRWSKDKLLFDEENYPKFKKEDTIVIATVARLVPQKDLATLLKAFKLVVNHFPKALLKIVGVGSEEKQLKELSECLGVSESVFWLASQSNPYDSLGHVDLFILTSRYEGFGLVLLEWINQGKPAVVSKIPPFQEILGIRYPYYCEVGNAYDFAQKITGAATSCSYVEVSRAFEGAIKEFDVSKMGSRVQKVYKEL